MLIEDEHYDRVSMLRQIAFNASDVEDIAALPRGFFTGTPAMQQPVATVKTRVDAKHKVLTFSTSKKA